MLELAVSRALPFLEDLSKWADFVEKQRKGEESRGDF
jgi:hypothetical protein